MEITRNQIVEEKDFKNLKVIGKAFREDGHVVALNVSEEKLKEKLLEIFDANYAIEAKEENIEKVEEAKEENNEEAKEIAESIVEETKSADPYDNSKLYYTLAEYNDWESGWTYNPATDEPKELPKKLSEGLKNALKTGRIRRFVK